MKKYFGFDDDLLFENSIFDDDIFDNNDNLDNCVSSNLNTINELLKELNELFSSPKQQEIYKKYGCTNLPIFIEAEEKTIDNKSYIFLTAIKEYIHSYSTKVKFSGVPLIFADQKLIDFINDNNIIFQCPICIDITDRDNYTWVFNTYIFKNITIPDEMLLNFLLAGKDNEDNKIRPIIYLDNAKCNNKELELLMNSNYYEFVSLYTVIINNCDIKTFNITRTDGFTNIKLTNNSKLTDVNIDVHYKYKFGEVNIVINNCSNLTNVDISDNSNSPTIRKININKCPNINKNTLILPNHNTKKFINSFLNDKKSIQAINFRGPEVEWFYRRSELGKTYKFPYHDISKYYNMYWNRRNEEY